MNRIVSILAFLLFPVLLQAAEMPLNITETTEVLEFQSKNVNQFIDNTGSLSIHEVSRKKFTPWQGPYVNLHIGSAYWVRFDLNVSSKEQKKWIVEFLDSHQELIEVFLYREGKLDYSAQAGQQTRSINDEYKHKNHIIDLPLKAQDQVRIFIKVKSGLVGSMLFKIRTNSNFSTYALKEYYFLGIYYGILFLIAVINIILFILLKERIYAMYLIYVLSWIVFSLIDDGIGGHLYWFGHHSFDLLGFFFAKPVLIISYVWYSLIFFKGKEISSFDRKVILFSTGGYVVLQLSELIFGYSSTITTWIMFTPLLMVLGVAVKSYNKGYLPSRFFVLGNFFILMGFAMRFMGDLAIISFEEPNSTLSILLVYSRNLGIILEIITLTLALGDRFRFIKTQNEQHKNQLIKEYKAKESLQSELITKLQENELLKDKVNRELEDKVKERTLELEELNGKLQEQAEQINEMNRHLDLDNYKLKNKVKEANSSRVLFKDLTFEEFKLLYPDKSSILRFLNENKWQNGYTCRKCSNEKYCDGNTKFSRRCTKCRYDESITAYTLFHKCKFPLEQAFYIISKTIRKGDKLNSNALSEELDLRKATVWNYRNKVIASMEKNKKFRDQEDFINKVILDPK